MSCAGFKTSGLDAPGTAVHGPVIAGADSSVPVKVTWRSVPLRAMPTEGASAAGP